MKASDLPEHQRIYTVRMTNSQEFEITGAQKEKLQACNTQFVQLPNGTQINRSYIVTISLNKEATKDKFRKEQTNE